MLDLAVEKIGDLAASTGKFGSQYLLKTSSVGRAVFERHTSWLTLDFTT
jgi:hypothetical protein